VAGRRFHERKRKRGKRKWESPELKTVHYRNHSCPDKKITYETRREAKKAARIIQGLGRDLLTPYECKMCGGIHLGHDSRRGF
jgi:hypothetical protein